jgi:hypothetical protein
MSKAFPFPAAMNQHSNRIKRPGWPPLPFAASTLRNIPELKTLIGVPFVAQSDTSSACWTHHAARRKSNYSRDLDHISPETPEIWPLQL